MSYPDGAQSVFAQVMRVSTLDVNGFPAVGSNTFTTNQLLKCTVAPVVETGVDLVTINANGDIASHFKHGDMPKYYSVQLEISSPDPVLHQMLAGGSVLTDTTAALTTPTAPTGTPSTTGGTLGAGSYKYIVTAANQYGETVGSPRSSAITVTGTTGSVALSVTAVTGAVYYRWYGRTSGQGADRPDDHDDLHRHRRRRAGRGPAGIQHHRRPRVRHRLPGGRPRRGGQPERRRAGVLGQGDPQRVAGALPAVLALGHPRGGEAAEDTRTFQPAILENVYMGQAFENPNWGAGPFGDWQFDSTKVFPVRPVGLRDRAGVRPHAGPGHRLAAEAG